MEYSVLTESDVSVCNSKSLSSEVWNHRQAWSAVFVEEYREEANIPVRDK